MFNGIFDKVCGNLVSRERTWYLFEDALIHQIKFALKRCEGKFLISKTQGRIFVEAEGEFDYGETVAQLQHVFGISGICPMIYVEDEGFEKLSERVVRYVDEVYPDKNKTFKVNARRARKNYPRESMEINADLGEAILNAYPEMKVDVYNPEIMLCGNPGENLYLFRNYPRSRRYACGNRR